MARGLQRKSVARRTGLRLLLAGRGSGMARGPLEPVQGRVPTISG